MTVFLFNIRKIEEVWRQGLFFLVVLASLKEGLCPVNPLPRMKHFMGNEAADRTDLVAGMCLTSLKYKMLMA